eukprot:759080-Hanusia_phi.AAC.1
MRWGVSKLCQRFRGQFQIRSHKDEGVGLWSGFLPLGVGAEANCVGYFNWVTGVQVGLGVRGGIGVGGSGISCLSLRA